LLPPPESSLRFVSPNPPGNQLEHSVPIGGNPVTVPISAVVEAGKPSTSSVAPDTPPTSSSASSSPTKKKKKKKQTDGEKKPKKHLRSAGGTVWEDQTLLDWDPSKPSVLFFRFSLNLI